MSEYVKWVALAIISSKAIRALKAVLDLHAPMEWRGECPCTDAERDDPRGEHQMSAVLIGDDFWACEKGRAYPDRCQECTAVYPDHDDVTWPCPTVKTILDIFPDGGAES